MKTHDFYYDLPEELIAQTPLEKRDASRLMVLNRQTGEVTHKHFYDIIDYLDPGDCLVLNDSRWRCCCCGTWAIRNGSASASPAGKCRWAARSYSETVS